MDEFKDFEGKQLDTCIKEACEFYNCPREKLEIEIIQDAKSGIFGIVGARKAKIRARKIQLPEKALNFLDGPKESGKPVQKKRFPSQEKPHQKTQPGKSKKLEKAEGKKINFSKHKQRLDENPSKVVQQSLSWSEKEDFPGENIENLDPEKVKSLTCETVANLLRPIAGKEISASAEIAHGRVRVNVQWEGDAGLLIGREGQTLASLQYIASRILSHTMNAGVRGQLEIGNYKTRQDEKLKERAHFLAEKARQTGKSLATPPLSSYHRRIIHIELQNEPGIFTRSFGDGIMKKVIITPKNTGETG